MKRNLYLALMITFFVSFFNFIYFIGVFSMVYYRIVSIRNIIPFTDFALHPGMFALVTLFAIIIGYPVGKKWWKIIYVD
jgi:hypothetical protein